MHKLLLLGLGVAIATPLAAQDATSVAIPGGATAQGDIAVTIYNNGQSLVQSAHHTHDVTNG